jgi:hypothetical protein
VSWWQAQERSKRPRCQEPSLGVLWPGVAEAGPVSPDYGSRGNAFKPVGCIWPLADYQAKLACLEILGRYRRPDDLKGAIQFEIEHPHFDFEGGQRHAMEVDYHGLRRDLRGELLKTGVDAHHVFTYANALDRVLVRIGEAGGEGYAAAGRGILHGAMALYLTRYLNVPPAHIPGDGAEPLDDLPAEPETIRAALLDAFDWQRQVDLAARLVARHLTLGHSPQALIVTLARALLREDAGFHAYQMLEAGVRQFAAWGSSDEGRRILIAVARYLAAHSPTERAQLQTADIARRLTRGGELHQVTATS